MIEVFVRSSSVHPDIDIGTMREMSMHTHCAPGAWEGLLKNYGKFKGRLLSPDDQEILQKLEILANKFHDEIKVYDVSRSLDKVKAMRQGIRKTPTVIVQGKKYESLEKILQLIE
jgi:hypothetical protein